MEKKSLFISFGEVLRVTKKNDNTVEYLICDDNVAMREVTQNEFIEFMGKLSNVCLNSWNKELAEKYNEIKSFVNAQCA